MDGTLADTEPHWLRAQSALLARHGLPALTREQELKLVGASPEISVGMFQRLGMTIDPEVMLDEVYDDVCESVADGVAWRPGAVELLADLNAHRVPTALVTNSSRPLADVVLDHLHGGEFTITVTSSDVRPGKPDPAPFLFAAARLGVDPADCLVIEDSMNGIRGALAAGCVTLAVPHGMRIPPSPDYVLRESLRGLDWAHLRDLYAAFRAQPTNPTDVSDAGAPTE
jgi:HAD superfamily hydrolase (TIGR01509 family)